MSIKKYLVFIALFSLSVLSAQNSALFKQATEFYNNGEFSKAIENYEQILESGNHSASLYFNMGNCYYKLNAIGPSIYYYEKALLLSPNDTEIKNNLQFAQNMRLDAIEEMPQTEMSQVYNKVINWFSCNGWAYLTVIFSILFVLIYLAYYFIRMANQKRIAFIASFFSLGLAIFCVLMGYLQHDQQKKNNPAIVFNKEINVNAEPNSNSEVIFTLHEGTKVNILDELDGYKKIRIVDGQTGWLLEDSIKALKDF
ncbi:tetratricopeptide repeat protein [Allomuricauda sp. NBRC 101325]|uniref:tetratricopeptide repeat protein n=1 Tax=Allomuricauda sp. NBRC 101325 TaxID=1113758 RepID=UPI0024A5019E|nr:tetratricopeptide repeat protein [Muricauda sp. NBRC 101325]GLU43375.1 BatE protein [Muricauda sp. NBRC 101325]